MDEAEMKKIAEEKKAQLRKGLQKAGSFTRAHLCTGRRSRRERQIGRERERERRTQRF